MGKHEESKKIKILFICLGNICRSPAAEGIMKYMVAQRGMDSRFEIGSAGLLDYHEGESPDGRIYNQASLRGYQLTSFSRPITSRDYFYYDLIIGMDHNNIQLLKQRAPDVASRQKIRKMTDYCRKYTHDHIPDPYYGGISGFELVLDLLEDACEGLLEELS